VCGINETAESGADFVRGLTDPGSPEPRRADPNVKTKQIERPEQQVRQAVVLVRESEAAGPTYSRPECQHDIEAEKRDEIT
jgi:hypothetical protein